MNSVACSPGWPSKRIIGRCSQSISFAASSLSASAFQSSIGRTTPKCGIGTALPSTAPLDPLPLLPVRICADIWWPNRLKSNHVSDDRPGSQPSTSQ